MVPWWDRRLRIDAFRQRIENGLETTTSTRSFRKVALRIYRAFTQSGHGDRNKENE